MKIKLRSFEHTFAAACFGMGLLCLTEACSNEKGPGVSVRPGAADPGSNTAADLALQKSKFIAGDSVFAEKVLSLLYDTYGEFSHPKPGIKILYDGDDSFVASYEEVRNTIWLSHQALKICRDFGPDSLTALSVIIGHEFGHFAQRKISPDDGCFASFANPEHYSEHSRAERSSDVFGIFLTFLSGLPEVKRVHPKVVEALYKEFQLPDKIGVAYPDRRTRERATFEVLRNADTLLHVFELGNSAALFNELYIAEDCLQFIRKFYNGPEILNNLGWVKIKQALDKLPHSFVFPLEPDLNTALAGIRFGDTLDALEQIEIRELLESALKHLDAALMKRRDYPEAILNKSFALTLDRRPREALSWLDAHRRQLAGTRYGDKMIAARALILASTPDRQSKKEGARLLDSLKRYSPSRYIAILAEKNGQILKNESRRPGVWPNCRHLSVAANGEDWRETEPSWFSISQNTKLAWTGVGGKQFFFAKYSFKSPVVLLRSVSLPARASYCESTWWLGEYGYTPCCKAIIHRRSIVQKIH